MYSRDDLPGAGWLLVSGVESGDLPGAGWLLVSGVESGRLTGGWVVVSVRCTATTTYRGLGGC